MRPRAVLAALLLAGLTGVSGATAAPLERGVVYSKTIEREAASGESEVAPVGGLYTLRGTVPRRITYDPADAEPDVSPDGIIAFVREGNVYLVHRDGSGLRQLTGGPEIDQWPLFAPNGRSLVFTRRAEERGPRDLYLVRFDGMPPRPLTASPEDDSEAAFSLDGRAIAFVRRFPARGRNGDLYSVRPDATGLKLLVARAVEEFSPRYFAGGILFNRRRSLSNGTPDVYRMRGDGSQVEPLIAQRAGASIRAVAPDGRRLFFASRGSFWSTTLDRRGDRQPRRVIPSFGGDELAVSPDGRWGAFLLYFDEIHALTIIDLQKGGIADATDTYDEGDGVAIGSRLAW